MDRKKIIPSCKRAKCGMESNWFMLKGNKDCYFNAKVAVEYTPAICAKRESNNIEICSIIPTFNNDGKYFTPAFIVPYVDRPSDKELFEEHLRNADECRPIAGKHIVTI